MRDLEFNNCVDEHADGVYRFILKNIGHIEDAQDIVQTAFEKLWINRNKVASIKAKSYLFTVAYHQMIDHIRKEKKEANFDSYEAANAKVIYQKDPELKQLLLAAINELNPTQKSLVLLKDYEGYTYQEIGEIMNLSESQVKVYLHRARIFLKEKLVHFEKVAS
jgi:RNA polymerase sigma-70 factor (ECF subfamily)